MTLSILLTLLLLVVIAASIVAFANGEVVERHTTHFPDVDENGEAVEVPSERQEAA